MDFSTIHVLSIDSWIFRRFTFCRSIHEFLADPQVCRSIHGLHRRRSNHIDRFMHLFFDRIDTGFLIIVDRFTSIDSSIYFSIDSCRSNPCPFYNQGYTSQWIKCIDCLATEHCEHCQAKLAYRDPLKSETVIRMIT